jgi:hypothetical protein
MVSQQPGHRFKPSVTTDAQKLLIAANNSNDSQNNYYTQQMTVCGFADVLVVVASAADYTPVVPPSLGYPVQTAEKPQLCVHLSDPWDAAKINK